MKMNFIFIIRNSGDCHECKKIQIAMLSTRIHRRSEGSILAILAVFGDFGNSADCR